LVPFLSFFFSVLFIGQYILQPHLTSFRQILSLRTWAQISISHVFLLVIHSRHLFVDVRKCNFWGPPY
jgi:hypothetical protein